MAEAAEAAGETRAQGNTLVIGAASLGTIFEWYDFYLYGSLAPVIAAQFFTGVNDTTGLILALLAFAAGFAVRPFGALVFGGMGDRVGRKTTFLITMILMGLSTFVVGLLPSFKQIGVLAPALLITMRLVQGLALGGEYGGAATYVAEHAPAGRRGLFTSWIQTTATVGLFLSLIVILAVRTHFGEDAFKAWAWRIPFLVSIVLLLVSVWIRLRLNESPVFQKMIAEGKGSKAPVGETFGQWKNLRLVLLALFGLTAGQAVVWYTGQFYALFFLEKTLKVDGAMTNILVAAALLIGTPFFLVFGWLSDKVGRKPIILLGCLLAALTYFPVFKALTGAVNPALAVAQASAPVKVAADKAGCHFQFDPVGKAAFTSPCDVATSNLAKAGVTYDVTPAGPGAGAVVSVGDKVLAATPGGGAKDPARVAWEKSLAASLKAAGYPAKADPVKINMPLTVGLLVLLVIYVTMVYGPIAAMLVEMFPTRIRYTAMSIPYHIGNGWFGGFLPTTAFAIAAATGNIYAGLWYPVVIAAATAGIGFFFLKDAKGADLGD